MARGCPRCVRCVSAVARSSNVWSAHRSRRVAFLRDVLRCGPTLSDGARVFIAPPPRRGATTRRARA
eukprot:7614570-Lingulodinium_polyedra.AAC.1